jgi:hypothetical protein
MMMGDSAEGVDGPVIAGWGRCTDKWLGWVSAARGEWSAGNKCD